MIHVFTGTQRGATQPQFDSLRSVLAALPPEETEAVHGHAIGADYQFHTLCRLYGFRVRGHPGDLTAKIAPIPAEDFAVLLPPKPNLARNRTMVDYAVLSSEKSRLIVCPGQDYEVLRSGTWATVRYARKACMDMLYIWPSDGALEPRSPGDPFYHSQTRQVRGHHASAEAVPEVHSERGSGPGAGQ